MLFNIIPKQLLIIFNSKSRYTYFLTMYIGTYQFLYHVYPQQVFPLHFNNIGIGQLTDS